jgi:hypothetical protein
LYATVGWDALPAAFPVPLAIIDGGMAAAPGLPGWVAVREDTGLLSLYRIGQIGAPERGASPLHAGRMNWYCVPGATGLPNCSGSVAIASRKRRCASSPISKLVVEMNIGSRVRLQRSTSAHRWTLPSTNTEDATRSRGAAPTSMRTQLINYRSRNRSSFQPAGIAHSHSSNDSARIRIRAI